jgi:hypothetical protein
MADQNVVDATPRIDASPVVVDSSPPLDSSPLDSSPSDLSAVAPTLKAPISLDFEGSSHGFAATGDWQWGPLPSFRDVGCASSTKPQPPTAAHSQTSLWGTSLDQCQRSYDNIGNSSCGAGDNQSAATLAFKVEIPSTFTSARLSYFQYIDIWMPGDWAEVRVDNAVVASYCTSSDRAPYWHEKTIDLSSHIGKTVLISFHAATNGYTYASANLSGWYLDDISVTQ